MQQQTIIQTNNSQNKVKNCLARIDNALESLAQQLERGQSQAMQRYLDAMAHFHHYSINNLMLILAQNSNATRVAGYLTWKRLGRTVNKGERAIRIIAPIIRTPYGQRWQDHPDVSQAIQDQPKIVHSYRTVCVFDVSQTDGRELPQPTRAHGDAQHALQQLQNAVRRNGIQLEYTHIGPAQGKSLKGRILIQPNMEPAETFATLAHEYAHEILHHTNNTKPQDRNLRELEAEAAACAVSQHYGLHTQQASADYILLWNGDKPTLLQRMETIRQCANRIIEEMEGGEKKGR